MTVFLYRLDASLVDQAWAAIEPQVVQACSCSSGRYLADHVRDFARRGLWQLWLVTEAGHVTFVLGTELVDYPTGLRALSLRFGVGERRERWLHLLEQILAFGRAHDCTIAEGDFRVGWRRVLKGWDHTHEFMERRL